MSLLSSLSGLMPGQVLQRRGGQGAVQISLVGSDPVTARVTDQGGTVRGPSLTPVPGGFLLDGVPTGGPYQVHLVSGKETLTIGPVFVGDLWLLGGQSNMEGMGDLADGPEPHPLVACFTLARRWEPAREPLHFLAESPDPVHHGGHRLSPDAVAVAKAKAVKGVGPGLWFARLRAETTGVPQGLVCAAHGGTSMTQWDPSLDSRGGDSLFGSLRLTLGALDQPLAGVLWYQGCDDTNPVDAALYPGRMEGLVNAVRRLQAQPELPWLVAQIGRVVGRTDEPSWNQIQDHQRRLSQTVPYLDVVSVVDLELDDWIHLSARAHRTLGERFQTLAARLVDQVPSTQPGPQPRSAHWDPSDPGGAAVRVTFDSVIGGWQSAGLPRGFCLKNSRGEILPYVCRTRIEGSEVVLRLTSDELGGLTVAYAQGCDPVANLVDHRGLALPSFNGLPISGLPAITGWFRRWSLHSLPNASTLDELTLPETDSPGWEPHVVQGWWYLVLDRWWPRGAVAGRSWFSCSQAMDLEIRLGNDVPFRFFLDGIEQLSEGRTDRLTSSNIDFEHHRLVVHVEQGIHGVAFLAHGREDGGMGLNLRLARTDRETPLPDLYFDPE